MNGEAHIEIFSDDKEISLKIKSKLDLSIFDDDYSDSDDIHLKALKLDILYNQFYAISTNKEAFTQLIEKMHKKNYINNEVVAIAKTYCKNKGLLFILEIAFPDVKSYVSDEINKSNVLNEIHDKIMSIFSMELDLMSIFKNIEKHNITKNDLKEHQLTEIYNDYINQIT